MTREEYLREIQIPTIHARKTATKLKQPVEDQRQSPPLEEQREPPSANK